MAKKFYSGKLAHVQVVISCQYSAAQLCTREDTLAHYLGALYLDDIMSQNELTTVKITLVLKLPWQSVDESLSECRRRISMISLCIIFRRQTGIIFVPEIVVFDVFSVEIDVFCVESKQWRHFVVGQKRKVVIVCRCSTGVSIGDGNVPETK